MVSLRKVAQHNKVENFSYVPDIPMDKKWTDTELYKRYSLSAEDVAFIDSMIREMSFTNE
jgi:site-specific DNA-methyltransferase (adenine-specific)